MVITFDRTSLTEAFQDYHVDVSGEPTDVLLRSVEDSGDSITVGVESSNGLSSLKCKPSSSLASIKVTFLSLSDTPYGQTYQIAGSSQVDPVGNAVISWTPVQTGTY